MHDTAELLFAAERLPAIAEPAGAHLPRGGWIGAVVRAGLQLPSPVVKQAPVLLMFVLAVAISVADAHLRITDGVAMVSGGVVIAVASGLAAALSLRGLRDSLWVHVVPALDFVAVELLRYSTVASYSAFGVLVVVPAIWVASNEGRRYIAWAVAGVVVVLELPLVLTPSALPGDPTGPIRVVYAALAYAITAVLVNELSRLARLQLRLVTAHDDAIGSELLRGGRIQQSILPEDGSPAAGYEIAGTYVPSRVVGGDFYDWYAVPGGFAVTLGDVMGKGVGAGMIAATTRAVLRGARDEADPVVAVVLADECLAGELGKTKAFATMFHARVDAADGVVRWVDAGHGLSLHVRADGTWDRLVSGKLPIGIDLAERWTSTELRLAEGDMLVSFSDGILDLWDDSLAAITAVAELAARSTSPTALADALNAIAIGRLNPDDVAAVVIRRATTTA